MSAVVGASTMAADEFREAYRGSRVEEGVALPGATTVTGPSGAPVATVRMSDVQPERDFRGLSISESPSRVGEHSSATTKSPPPLESRATYHCHHPHGSPSPELKPKIEDDEVKEITGSEFYPLPAPTPLRSVGPSQPRRAPAGTKGNELERWQNAGYVISRDDSRCEQCVSKNVDCWRPGPTMHGKFKCANCKSHPCSLYKGGIGAPSKSLATYACELRVLVSYSRLIRRNVRRRFSRRL